jgi:hypothetical protein
MLKSIIIPNNITSISTTFTNCNALINVAADNTSYTVITAGVSSIQPIQNIFPNMSNLELLSTVTSIPSSFFENNQILKSVIIPTSVTSIDVSAFNGCSNMEFIQIPANVTIGNNAFNGCSSLDTITAGNTSYTYNNTSTNILSLFPNMSDLELTNVTSIPEIQFLGNIALTSITIPDTVNSIGNSAFQGCTGLTSVNAIDLGNNVTIGVHIFDGCPSNLVVATYSTNLKAYIQTNYPNQFTITCFKEDSMILTEKGYVKVQELKKYRFSKYITYLDL